MKKSLTLLSMSAGWILFTGFLGVNLPLNPLAHAPRSVSSVEPLPLEVERRPAPSAPIFSELERIGETERLLQTSA